MSLADVKATYEKLGRDDPLYAILSHKRFRHNRWNPADFFHTGTREIREILQYVDRLGLPLRRQRALDFGCGVGRVSQALADHFERVVGVDIAKSMVQRARECNVQGNRVRYVANSADDLKILDDDSFDFVYSNITLQHIPPGPAKKYIGEFLRVLRPGGLAIYQVPSGKPYQPGSLADWIYTVRRRHLHRIWKMARGLPPVEIHYIARAQVEQIVRQNGGRIVHVVDLSKKRRRGRNFRYCATR